MYYYNFVDMQQYNQAWVLSRMRLEVSKLPKWKDKITIKTWINSLENSRSVRALEVSVNGEECIGVETFWAVFNTKTRRPEGMVLMHDHCEKYPENRATLQPFSKIEIDESKELLFERKVVLSDLDIVNHVNNVKYLEWCIDVIDEDIMLHKSIASLDMNFMKELSLGEVVAIYETNEENQTIFSISKESQSVFALQLNWK